jgi:ADP-ribosylglycohydrolase
MLDVPRLTESNRILGCILGGAIGDASGSPYEGAEGPVQFRTCQKWQLSDDTQLTLATCEAIASNHGRVEPSAIADHLASWHKQARISGMGGATYKALSELVQGGHWALVGRKGEYAAGNGAAMRIAPLAFCLDPTDPVDRQKIRDVSRITHHTVLSKLARLVLKVCFTNSLEQVATPTRRHLLPVRSWARLWGGRTYHRTWLPKYLILIRLNKSRYSSRRVLMERTAA